MSDTPNTQVAESPDSFEERRRTALETAIRCAHPGSAETEVLRVARIFEAYLRGD